MDPSNFHFEPIIPQGKHNLPKTFLTLIRSDDSSSLSRSSLFERLDPAVFLWVYTSQNYMNTLVAPIQQNFPMVFLLIWEYTNITDMALSSSCSDWLFYVVLIWNLVFCWNILRFKIDLGWYIVQSIASSISRTEDSVLYRYNLCFPLNFTKR